MQQVGAPQHLYEHPANLFVAGFVGSPAMNFLPAELDELAAEAGAAEVPGDGGDLVTRLSVDSRVREGERARVWFDLDKLHLLDPGTGRALY